MGQTEWVDHPDNPLIGPGPPESWDSGGHWLHGVVYDWSTCHMWFAPLWLADVGSEPYTDLRQLKRSNMQVDLE